MSQSKPASREEFKDFILRQLGHPVIRVNVDEIQIEDAVDNALQYYQEYVFDGTERAYLKHQITQDDVNNQFIPVDDSVIGITRVFPVGGNGMTQNMFDLRYQLRLNDLWDLSSTSYANYAITMQHLRTLDMLFSGETPIDFNKKTNKLYPHWDWNYDIQVGDWIVIDGYTITDPDTYTKVWNDRFLKKLATAYLKKTWGSNMKKYAGMPLPGGLTMNGQQIYDEAVSEIDNLEQQIRTTIEKPPEAIFIG